MKDEVRTLPKPYHDAIEHWQRHNFPDFPKLAEEWDRFFPKDEPFCLCAKIAEDIPTQIEVGDSKGQEKALAPKDLPEEAAQHLLMQIKAQASTEFGSIQQHQGTLARAQEPQDHAWALRVMAEERRHGYQMVRLLTSADWSPVTNTKAADMVEEILSMQTGSHVLDAFNLEYDTFIDNICFAAIVDRVGKYQLTMQKICAYKPMADSMPPMLREEAFHLAAGVIPLRRWAQRAAQGDPLVTMQVIQKSVNKWLPRALEMFGDERGGDTNVKFGFKDMKNREAQDLYVDEVRRMVRDINARYLRARFPGYAPEKVEQVMDDLERSRGRHDGVGYEDLIHAPDRRFFRRKGEPAWSMVGVDGETFERADDYVRYLSKHLPEAYLTTRDMRMYVETLRKVAAGELSVADAIKKMPRLKRVGGSCPCSRAVRWVVEEPAAPGAGAR